MKHNITTTTPQTMTASEIENLALHIIALKGNYDFTGTNVTITPPTDMSPGMAGIIVKCAQKTGGTVNINGATEISDDAWEYIKQYGAPLWMIKAMDRFGVNIPISFNAINLGIPMTAFSKAVNDKAYFTLNQHANKFITNFSLKKGYTIKTKIEWATPSCSYPSIYGQCGLSSNTSSDTWELFGYGSDMVIRSSGNSRIGTFANGTVYTIENSYNKIVVNGSTSNLSNLNDFPADGTTNKFMIANGPAASQGFAGKMWYLQICEGDTILHHFAPVANNKLYDFVTGEVVTNSGSSAIFGTED